MNATNPLTAVIFPGQGSQVKDMGRELAEASSDAMYLWQLAENVSQLPLREIYWGGDNTDMADTKALQPAMTVCALSLWMHAEKRISADCFAGHSLGEYPALAAAKILPVETVLALVSLRGRLMGEVAKEDEGMTAILRTPLKKVEEIVASVREKSGLELSVANYNTPSQFVLTGKKEALTAVAALVKEQKGRAIPLPVSGAFHSPLMAEAADELKSQLLAADWSQPEKPVYFNVTAGPEDNPERIRDIMVQQMTSPVRWIEIITNQYNAGVRTWYEPGPKGVLTKMLGQTLKGVDAEWTGKSLDSTTAILEAKPGL
ncbi:ACP S-malonyltransferase [Desulfobaculum bizertense]|uniref:Malonyl CoA-acyl carrier protein transacylase n=1 Tax=Desulfobaculum bizertense DSM 18034 TaxID=1121442 RepID=A0A1T4WJ18_9BACT|nr:ACP S-malonyltransferase [Desulfobaculum bizertense]UIJ39366.1 ACP S-malonyltransferase [Desulfobaculum bizertense]SKA76641.1 [Acyl-carrier-protein] S-malonyltransferase [Desulfobaculum bizertense DSM 18034]